jgi:hypothetical protein
MYGTGARPRIDGEGNVDQALLLQNVEYYEVSNLEITNTGVTAGVSDRRGVRVWANSSSLPIAHHIHLKNLYIHDVNGSLVKNSRGLGLNIWCDGNNSRFDDLLIEDCHLLRTDRDGIGFWSNANDPSRGSWNPSTNVVVRGNLLEDIGGDGIIVVGCESALVENNKLDGGRMRLTDEAAAGMWPWGSMNTLFQFNEVTGMQGTKDGQAFDCDYHCDGTIFQYNYSHDNDGGFMLFAGPGSSAIGVNNSVVRYNVSQNDGSNSRVFHLFGGVTNSKIYNNVVYLAPGMSNLLVRTAAWSGGKPTNNHFYNNIFYADGTWDYEIGVGSGMVFENNVFYGNHVSPPSDPFALYSDPMLVGPGTGGSGLDSVDGYMLQAGSPAINSGQDIADNGGEDYWGNPVPVGVTDRGAHETSGGGSYCGDATCDPGEDQCNCATDCGTPPVTETNCNDGQDEDCDGNTDCDDSDCLGDPACPSCGDLTCDPGEDQCNCPSDCGTPPATETNCTDGIDNDCGGGTDCDDTDCDTDPACASACDNDGVCESGEDCNNCPNDCDSQTTGPPNNRYCCGNGILEGPEGDGRCDGNI